MKILMCPPKYFQVEYNINMWMNGQYRKVDGKLAKSQWDLLSERISKYCHIELIEPQKNLCDQVFTANAGYVEKDQAVVSRFYSHYRQAEEQYFRNWFLKAGFQVLPWPEDICFEGAGDALLDSYHNLIWVGHGFRSDIRAGPTLGSLFNREIESLKLVNPYFYHLDTAFCPLSEGKLMWYPPAFDEISQRKVMARIPSNNRIELEEIDAFSFCCNAVEIGDGKLLLNRLQDALRRALKRFSFEAVETPMSEFIRAGGASKCLTLAL